MGFHEYVMGLWQDFYDMMNPIRVQLEGREIIEWWEIPVKVARALLDAYSTFESFRADWKWMRLAVPLRGRLLMEQLLWDRGLPWRSLITGFRAIEGDAMEQGVFGPASPPQEEQTPSQPHADDNHAWDTMTMPERLRHGRHGHRWSR